MFSSLILEGQRLILGIRYDPCFMIPADKIGIDQTDIATEETLGSLGEALVNVGHDLLESRGIESLAQNRSPANDVLSSLHFLGVAVQHLGLDFVPKGFGFSLGFLNQGFQFLQGFDFGCDFDGRHSGYLLYVLFGGIANPQVIFKSCQRGFRLTSIWA